MPKFVMLVNWTTTEAAAKDGTHQHFEELAARTHVKLLTHLWTMGRFDSIAVLEGEADHVSVMALALGHGGTVSTETIGAFDADDSTSLAEATGRVVGGHELGPGRVVG
jgi:uncharacterized protein with GYD domain